MDRIASVVAEVDRVAADSDMVAAAALDVVVDTGVAAGIAEAVDLGIGDRIDRSYRLVVFVVVPVVEAGHMSQNHHLAEEFAVEASVVVGKVAAPHLEVELVVAVGFVAPLLRPLQVLVLR